MVSYLLIILNFYSISINLAFIIPRGYEEAVNFFKYNCFYYIFFGYIIASLSHNKEEISMDHDRAEIIAINALSFIASDEKYLSGYLRLSGMSLEKVKAALEIQDKMKTILGSILDFMMQNEKCLIEFAETYELIPEDVVKARNSFPNSMLF